MKKSKACFYLLRLVLISLHIAFLFPLITLSQGGSEKGLPFITNYSAKTYKALPQTWCAIEDNSGMMYFGIQNYILEYDGIKWRKIIFTSNAANVVRAMTKNKYGQIYWGGYGDLGYLEADSLGQIKARSLLQLIPEEYRNFLDIWSAYAAGDYIYFQSREYIFRIGEQKQGAEKREVKVWKPQSRFMFSFYLDDNFYVHQQGLGLYKMSNDSLLLIPGSEFLGKERVQVMLPYHPGESGKQYLVGMFYSGLYLFDGKTFRPFATEADPILKSGLILYKGLLLKNGNYVLATTGKGLVIIDADGKLLQQINRDVGLQDESIYGTYEDKKGTLWLALDNGISRVETASPLTQFTLQSGINTGVLSIKRFNNDIYIGTTNGLLHYNRTKSFFDPVPGIPQNQIFTLYPDGEQLLVPGDGLFAIWNKKTITLRPSVSADLTISGLYISKKYPDILLAGGQFGVAVFTKKNITAAGTSSANWNFAGYIPNVADQIWNFAENKDGSFWGGTQNGLVYHFTLVFNNPGIPDPQKTIVEKFGAKHGFQNALGSVYSIKGVNYFVADSVLYCFDDTRKQFVRDSTFGTFPNGGLATEFDMAEDSLGRVWIRGGKLTRLAIPKPEGGYRLDDSQLNSIAELTIQKLFPEPDGILWVCTTDGLIRYDQNQEKNYEQPFKAILRHISAEKIPLSTAADADKKTVSVSFKNNTLRFEYAAPFFEQEDKTQYQTRLEGFEDDWSSLDNNYYKEYTNLSPGQYTFHVRAVNIYRKQSEEAFYTFTILPPWYRTWWAYLLYALTAAIIIYLLIRWRTRQLHEKHRELEKLVEQRTHELSHRVEELAVINSVQEGLVRQLDIDEIYELVGEKIRQIFNAQVIDIVTYDRKNNLLEDRYSYEKGDRTLVGKWEPFGFRKHVIDTGQYLLINENLAQKSVEFNSRVIHGEQPKSAIWMPLITGNEVTGMISLQDLDKEHAFTDSHISLLTTLANSMSVALESAKRFDETNRLLKETEQRTAELAVINSVQEGLARELNMQGIYDLVGNKIQDVFNAQAVIIATLDQETKTETFNYLIEKGVRFHLKPRPYDKLRQHLIDTKEKILINENFEEVGPRFGMKILPGTEHPKSLLFVPLISGDKVRSYVSLQNVDKENAFSDADVRLLETLANSMSVALENARLFDETNRLLKETEQRTAELAVINSVQDGLAKELDMEGVYNLVGDRIQELFNAQVVIIATFDFANMTECFNYFFENNEKVKADPRPVNKLRQLLIDKKHSIYIPTKEQAIREYGVTPIAGTAMTESLLFVPLLSGNNIKGYVSLQNLHTQNAFSESDIRLLETLANSMSVALENARLFDETSRLLKETEQRTAELAVINSVQEGLAKELNMQAIYDLVGEKIREIFNAQVIDIVTYDETSSQIEDRYTYEKGDRTLLGPRPLKGFRKHVIETARPLVINKNVEQERAKYDQAVMIGQGAKSLVMVPMIAGGKVTGVISLQNLDMEDAFPDSDVRLLSTLVNSMSVALENARLFDETNRLLKETEQRTAELAVINSVQEGLAKELDMHAIYELVGERILKVFNAPNIVIRTFDHETGTENWRYAIEKGERQFIKPKPFVWHSKQLIQTQKPIQINENYLETSKKYGGTGQFVGQPTKSGIFVPMVVGGKVRGSVSLQNVDKENAFTDSDLRLLTTMTNSMSVALENARLFDETNRLLKETEQRTAELAVINSVQEGLAKELDMQGIYNLVGERLCTLFPDTQTLVIRTFDYDKGLEHFQYAIEKGVKLEIDPRPFMWANKILIETKKPLDIRENYVETAHRHGGSGVTKGQPPKSAVFVPMMVGDVVKGSVSLQNVDKEFAFNDSDLRLLTTITNSMSVALENARLFDETNRLLKETEQRTAELAVINSVQEGLVREMNMQAIYDLVGNRICELFDTQTVLIRTFDNRTETEHWQYVIEKGQRLYSNPRPLIWANKLLIQTKQPLLINNNYLETARKYGGTGVSKGLPPKSALFVPMIVGDVVRGSVSLQNVEKENAFTESDLRLLTTLTNSMSVALENARLFDETNRLLGEAKQRANELSTVNHISQGLASQLNMDELIKLVGEQLRQLFKANIVYLAILDPKTKIIHFPYQYGDNMAPLHLGEGLTSKIILQGEPLLINKDLQELRTQMGIQPIGIPAASYLGVPIPVGDEVIGVLSVQSTEHENRFNDDDLRLLSTIAASVGVALRKAKLFEEVQVAKTEAESARKAAEKANDAKSAFLSTVSHELRTPLTSVLGFAKIIKKRLDEKIFPVTDTSDPKTEKTIQQISENLKVVVSEGERLTHLINDVLDLAKIEAGKMEWNMETVSMPEIAERAIAATTALFENKNLVLEKNIESKAPDITGDRDKLIQVMVNLISNSVKFTPKGKVTCRVFQKDDEIIASITDTGIGIAPDDHAAVFEQFRQVGDTLTDKPKGTGLGLPICKEIIEHHGGRIWLDSELGKGSTFSIALPVKKTIAPKPLHLDDLVKRLKEQVVQSQLSINGKIARVLVVDDDDSIRSLLQQELGDAGYLIEEATNGKEALAKVRANRPDLVILDIMMPEMNGFDVAAVLKNDPQTMDIPIIVLSIVQDKARGFRIGVDRYLTKPIDTGILFNEIGSLLEQGKSKKKVMIVDEDSATVNTLTDVLKTKGYAVTESNGKELVEKAVANQPDIIIINSLLSGKQDIVQTLRFEKGLENVLFLVYQ